MAHNIMTNVFNFYTLLLFGGISFLLLNSVAGEAKSDLQKCQKGFFFDDVLKKCENCYAVCKDAVLQRTEDKCALCEDWLQPKSGKDSHESSPVVTAIWVTAVALVCIILIIGIVLIAFFKIRPLQRMCQHLRARQSLQDIIGATGKCTKGQGNDMEDDNVQEISVLIENPQHDPQNVYDYEEQRRVDLKQVHSGQKNMQREITDAHHNGQIITLVHVELQDSIKMGPAGINIQETLLKTT